MTEVGSTCESDYNLDRYCHNDPVNKSDPFGLELDAVYSIGSQTLTITNLDNGQKIVVSASSGSNKLSEVGLSDRGPVPLGNYSMYDRGADKSGASRYILDPNDSRPNNDTLDGKSNEEGGGRYAFRLHAEDANAPQKGSEGCVVVGRDKLGKIDKMASDTTKGPKATIVSEGKKPGE
jgi:type VI secretion system (T6SS) effector TldE1-like protein